MFYRRLILLTLTFTTFTGTAAGDVVVLANRTGGEVPYRIVGGLSGGSLFRLPAWDVVPVPTRGPCEVEVHWETGRTRYRLDANSAYYIGKLRGGRLELHQIGLGSDEETRRGRRLAGAGRDVAQIGVKILVDEEEPGRERLWQERLQRRVDAASEILEKHCRVRLAVVGFDTWDSDNATTDFRESMAEFEREVDHRPARLAIGFSSQYHLPQGRTHMGGTRGPLHSHVLLREWSKHVSERERLELLVHELGHYLGAAHSPEANSVMRPVLGDRKARSSAFQIGFDPVNTLAMYLVGEEIRYRSIHNFGELTPQTKRRLRQIYTELGRANPQDDSAKRFVQLVQKDGHAEPSERPTRSILRHILSAAEGRSRMPPEQRPEGDALTEYYVRRAARAAALLDDDVGPSAFLLALGVAVDDAGALRSFPKTSAFVQAIETDTEFAKRLKIMGTPTLRDRPDHTKHFFVSAYLAAALDPRAAATTGEAKELLDAVSGSGFSFADMAANRAGITFARQVLAGSIRLETLMGRFRVEHFMPGTNGLEEGLTLSEFQEKYGSKTDKRYLARLQEIDRRIVALPPYRGRRGD